MLLYYYEEMTFNFSGSMLTVNNIKTASHCKLFFYCKLRYMLMFTAVSKCFGTWISMDRLKVIKLGHFGGHY